MIGANQHVEQMAAYVLANLDSPAGSAAAMLSQNESHRPPSPRCVEAAARAAATANRYPDPDWRDLRGALAERYPSVHGEILCGAGSMELIAALGAAWLAPGRSLVVPELVYGFFVTVAAASGATLLRAPEREYRADVDALIDACRDDTAMVAIANPANPTGTRIANTELRRLREAMPRSAILLIDEAYGEYTDALEPPIFDLVERGDTVVLRTFSKAWALAGARVGWGCFPTAIAQQLRKLLNPNNIALTSQAMARAALDDTDWMQQGLRETAEQRHRFTVRLRERRFAVPDSYTNFVLLPLADAGAAAKTECALRNAGILVRPLTGDKLGHCLRIGVGTAAEMDRCADTIFTTLEGSIT